VSTTLSPWRGIDEVANWVIIGGAEIMSQGNNILTEEVILRRRKK
jgi:hypothetical protein